MVRSVRNLLAFVLAASLWTVLAGCTESPSPTPTPMPILPATPTPQPTLASLPSATPTPRPTAPPVEPSALVSQESLLAYLEDLTAIQPHSGWRNSATQGEAEALEYVAERLDEFTFLRELGLTLERQSFRIFLSTELWETRLHLTVNGVELEVPADGLRGPRDEIAQALRFDSDGTLNDSRRDPVTIKGSSVLVRSAQEIDALSQDQVEGKVVFTDYAAVDRMLQPRQEAVRTATNLLSKGPAGVVLVTRFSNEPGESHGAFVGDVSALNSVTTEHAPPVLYVRLEDLASAGIATWDDLEQVEGARLTWDADVFSPGTSGNLVAYVPGADPSGAVILGAHIDSPNGPGAMDDGSGSAILLEVARVLDTAQVQPAVDLYLVWFGSEEAGLYGSYHFVSTHQELLDRTLAMLQIDCLTHPLDGIDAYLNLITWSYGRLGDERLTWPDYLTESMAAKGVETFPVNYYGVESDNSAFAGFDVPNANLIYMDAPTMEELGGVHYAAHIHDPYDTVDLARAVGDVLEQMAHVALTAATDTGQEDPELRVAPPPERRALFVASHTESVHMAPTTLTDLGMALSWEGYDVDLIPYGQAVTPGDLKDAALVIVLPVLDYPSPDGDATLYDEAWSLEEIAALEAYVADGGFLVLSNSAHRLKYNNWALDANEDWIDVNELAERFGIVYRQEAIPGRHAGTRGESPLVEGVARLELIEGNAVPLRLLEGKVLAEMDGNPVAGLVDYGNQSGTVLALADLGILGANGEPHNLAFWQNLARYARSR